MKNQSIESCTPELSEDDIYNAMKQLKGYLDITPGDFREIYRFAYQHATERFEQSVRAEDIMTRTVISVQKSATLADVAEMLNQNLITGVPVINNENNVVGIISEKDFLAHLSLKKEKTFMGILAHCLKGTGCIAVEMRTQKACDIMTSPAVTVHEKATIKEIAAMFTQYNINRVPVINKSQELIGIVTRTDIVRSSCMTTF